MSIERLTGGNANVGVDEFYATQCRNMSDSLLPAKGATFNGEPTKPITNYEKLFGTPERAAKTMDARCERSCVCDMCVYHDAVCTTHDDCVEGVTKWLNQEVST